MDYAGPLIVDLTLLIVCGALNVRYGRLRHSHPTTIYLFFHLYTFSWRLIGLAGGAPTLFSDWGPFFDIVEPSEIVRAVYLADLALVSITVATIIAARRVPALETAPIEPHRKLSTRLIWVVGLAALIPGVWGMMIYRPGATFSEGGNFDPLASMHESSYVQILPGWPTLVLLILIYLYGFRAWLVLPMVGCLLFMSVQGYHRFRVIIPCLMMLQIFLDRRRLRWPPVAMVAGLLLLAAVFFPMKRIGRLAQHGASASDIAMATAEVTGEALAGRADDQAFLDEFACGLTQVDAGGKLFWGRPYGALVTLPIPRKLWAAKPSPADHIREISTQRRPMFEAGMIITFLGEAYANFSYAGVVLVPFLLAYALSRFHHAAYVHSYDTVLRFTYVMVGSNLIQVYRDGLASLVVFTAVNMMPLTVLMVLHRLAISPERESGTTAIAPAAPAEVAHA